MPGRIFGDLVEIAAFSRADKLNPVSECSDHPIMRDGLRLCIQREADMRVVCEASELAQILRKFWIRRPHVVVIDLSRPRDAGLRAMNAIRDLSPQAPLVMLASEFEELDRSP
jgi:DNA-binding NarL/FixJ family response regulator